MVDFDLNIQAALETRRLDQQLRQVETRLNQLSRRGVTVDPRLAQTPDQLRQIAAAAGNSAKGLETLARANRIASQTGRALTNDLKATVTETEQLGIQTRATTRRFAGYLLASRGISTVVDSLANATRGALEFNRELVRVAQLANVTTSSTRGLASTISDVSTSYGTSAAELARVAQVFLQAGKSITETQTLLASIGPTVLTASFPDLRTTANSILALNTQFRLLEQQSTAALDSLNVVAKEANTSVAELFDGLRRGGAAFAALSGATERATGDSLNLDNLREFSAIFATVIETTRESAATVGTSLRTILPRLSRRETVDVLREFGIEVERLNQQTGRREFIGAAAALREIQEGLAGLAPTDTAFIRIAEQLGGLRQFNRVIPLLTRASRVQELYNETQEASGSVAEDAALAQEDLTVKIEQLQQRFAELTRTVVGSSAFQSLANSFVVITNNAVTLANALEPLIPLLGALVAFRGARFASRAIGAGAGGRGLAGVGLNSGGSVRGTISAMTTKGEVFVEESQLGKFGGAANVLSYNKFNRGGRIPGATQVARGVHLFTSGVSANVDSIPTQLPPGVVIRRSGAGKFLSQNLNKGGRVRANDGFRVQTGPIRDDIRQLSRGNQELFTAGSQAFRRLISAGEGAANAFNRITSILRNTTSDALAIQKLTNEGSVTQVGSAPGRSRFRGGGTNSGSLAIPIGAAVPQNDIIFASERNFVARQAAARRAAANQQLTALNLGGLNRRIPVTAGARVTLASQLRRGANSSGVTVDDIRRFQANSAARRADALQALGGIGVTQFGPSRAAFERNRDAALRRDAFDALNGPTRTARRSFFQRTRDRFGRGFGRGIGSIRGDIAGIGGIRGALRTDAVAGLNPNNISPRVAQGLGIGAAGLAFFGGDNQVAQAGANVLGGAAIGSQLGPVGAAVGALAGLESSIRNLTLAANTEALDGFRKSLEEIQAANIDGDRAVRDIVQEIERFGEEASGSLAEVNIGIEQQNRQFRQGFDSSFIGLNQRDRAAFNRASAVEQIQAVGTDILTGGLERNINSRERLASRQRAIRAQEVRAALEPQRNEIDRQLSTFVQASLRETLRSGGRLPAANNQQALDQLGTSLGDSFIASLNEEQLTTVRNFAGGGQSAEAVLRNELQERLGPAIAEASEEALRNAFSRNQRAVADRVDVARAGVGELPTVLARATRGFAAIGSGSVQSRLFSGQFGNLRGPARARATEELSNLERILDPETAGLARGLLSDRAALQNDLTGFINERLAGGDIDIGTDIGQVVRDFAEASDFSKAGAEALNRVLTDVEGTVGGTLAGDGLRELIDNLSNQEEFTRSAQLSSEALRALQQRSEAVASAFNAINQASAQLSQAVIQQNAREFGQRQQRNAALGIGPRVGTRAATFAASRFELGQAGSLTGNIDPRNNQAIGNRLSALRERLAGGNIPLREQQQLNSEINNLTQALQLNANQTATLSTINQELASVQQARQGSRSFIEGLVTGGPGARREATRNLDIFRQFAAGGRVRDQDVAGALQTARGFAGSLNADQLASGQFDRVFGGQVRSQEDLENLIFQSLGGRLGGVAGNASTRDILNNTLTPNTQTGLANQAETEILDRRQQLINFENQARRQLLDDQQKIIDLQVQAAETLANSQIQVAFTRPLRIEGTETFTQQLAEAVSAQVQSQIDSLATGGTTPTPGQSPAGANGA